ncbi:hypothetical protein MKX03_024712 [Papaver bracteatum]|nr:hypothetical protein MKX03_024712 [Papaver bracteatum]
MRNMLSFLRRHRYLFSTLARVNDGNVFTLRLRLIKSKRRDIKRRRVLINDVDTSENYRYIYAENEVAAYLWQLDHKKFVAVGGVYMNANPRPDVYVSNGEMVVQFQLTVDGNDADAVRIKCTLDPYDTVDESSSLSDSFIDSLLRISEEEDYD